MVTPFQIYKCIKSNIICFKLVQCYILISFQVKKKKGLRDIFGQRDWERHLFGLKSVGEVSTFFSLFFPTTSPQVSPSCMKLQDSTVGGERSLTFQPVGQGKGHGSQRVAENLEWRDKLKETMPSNIIVKLLNQRTSNTEFHKQLLYPQGLR